MFDPLIIVAALLCGMASRAVGLPALIGYLAAGFVLYEMDVVGGELLELLAEIGITLLLFSIGLKLQPSQLLRVNVWGTTTLQLLTMHLLFLLVLTLAGWLVPALQLDIQVRALVAFALTFSSTVFVIQLMQERGEMASRHASLAVGILILQDLAAVLFLVFSGSKVPDPSALLLLLLVPLRPLVLRLLTHCGHGELFTLFGLVLAIGGAALFQSQGIKGDLGALLIGAALAGHQKSKELARNLLHFKDLFLVGFFLTIGMQGWPAPEIVGLAVVLGLLVVFKPLIFFPPDDAPAHATTHRPAGLPGAVELQRIRSYRHRGGGQGGLAGCPVDQRPVPVDCRQLFAVIPGQQGVPRPVPTLASPHAPVRDASHARGPSRCPGCAGTGPGDG